MAENGSAVGGGQQVRARPHETRRSSRALPPYPACRHRGWVTCGAGGAFGRGICGAAAGLA
eukprot:5669766-Prymnesium_polylepis.1